jgi:hypothetical protein
LHGLIVPSDYKETPMPFIKPPTPSSVTPQPWDQGGTSVLSAIPWINDSTTEQNEIFIA